MRMRTTMKQACVAAALFLGAGQAFAADMPPEPPILVPPPVVDVAEPSCIYVRVDGGYSFNDNPKVSKNHSAAFGEDMDDSWFADAGVGCQVTPYFRADITVGVRDGATMDTPFNDLDAEFTAYTGMVNAYWDIANLGGVTPYVGVGAGLTLNNLHDINLPTGQRNNTRADFAWAVMAGVQVELSDNVSLDAGYRYIDLGKAKAKGNDPIVVKDLVSHDVRVGIRYNFND